MSAVARKLFFSNYAIPLLHALDMSHSCRFGVCAVPMRPPRKVRPFVSLTTTTKKKQNRSDASEHVAVARLLQNLVAALARRDGGETSRRDGADGAQRRHGRRAQMACGRRAETARGRRAEGDGSRRRAETARTARRDGPRRRRRAETARGDDARTARGGTMRTARGEMRRGRRAETGQRDGVDGVPIRRSDGAPRRRGEGVRRDGARGDRRAAPGVNVDQPAPKAASQPSHEAHFAAPRSALGRTVKLNPFPKLRIDTTRRGLKVSVLFMPRFGRSGSPLHSQDGPLEEQIKKFHLGSG